MAPQVEFYVLNRSDSDPLRFACRLAQKAYKSGNRVYIDALDDQQVRHLDELLWTFSDISFVPHDCAGTHRPDRAPVPVSIGHDNPPDEAGDVLLTLRSEAPEYFSRFQRVLEIVSGGAPERSRARQRYRFYQDRGFAPETHQIDG